MGAKVLVGKNLCEGFRNKMPGKRLDWEDASTVPRFSHK